MHFLWLVICVSNYCKVCQTTVKLPAIGMHLDCFTPSVEFGMREYGSIYWPDIAVHIMVWS